MADIASVRMLVGRIIENLDSSAFKEINWLWGLKDELLSVKPALYAVDARLLYVLQRQLTIPSTGLQHLRLVISHVEDVVDLILTQDLELKSNGKMSSLHQYTTLFTNRDLSREIKSIRGSLKQILDLWDFIVSQKQRTEPLHCPYLDASDVIGREEDKKRIMSCLTSTVAAECLRVIPITGVGGMGKTTLARLIYNDPDTVARFQLRLWVTVYDKFEVEDVMKEILLYATRTDSSHLHGLLLQNKLVEILLGKTYFLVLDDVCISDPMQWNNLMHLFALGSPKSRILVTTREERVAFIVGANEVYNLQRLSDEDCWSIFSKHAFARGDEKDYPSLVDIGKSIVRKCHGVPLVAQTLGGLLWWKRDRYSWKRIEKSELWKIAEDPNPIFSSLKSSYDRLPYPLASCFAMCAIYQKGCPLFRRDMINVWMALGLLQPSVVNENLEAIGNTSFNQLLSASLLQSPGYDVAKKLVIEYGQDFVDESKFWNDLVQLFEGDLKKNLNLVLQTFFQPAEKSCFLEMHDLMHDLASYVSKDDIAIVNSDRQAVPTTTMHILWNHEDLSRFSERLNKLDRTRVFAFACPMGSVSKASLDELISSLKRLRILDLSYSEFEELPETIKLLKHLRYLKLGWNLKLNRLPESTSSLVNLQSLDLFRCIELEKLPRDMHKLVSLRFFSLTTKLECFSASMFGLRSLRVLRLSFCQNMISLPEEIGNLKNLLELEILCCACLVRLPNAMSDLTLLERLSVFCCQRLDLEDWDGLYGLENLRTLDLNELPELTVFPRGLQAATSLHDLRIQKCESLRTLRKGVRGCISLLRLTLTGCPVLTHIPRAVRYLTKLQQVIVDDCDELETRCVKEGSDWSLISHVPEIIINRQVLKK